jgi:tetratricopeptide (TPR) repeat protein
LKIQVIEQPMSPKFCQTGILAGQNHFYSFVRIINPHTEIIPSPMRRKTGVCKSSSHLLMAVLILTSVILLTPVVADTSTEVAASYIMKGDDLMAQKLYHEALEMYDTAVAYDPFNSMGWNKLGIAHMRIGRYEDAVDSFEKAIAIDPFSANAWTNLGDSLAMLERHGEALKAYDRALAINQKDTYALLKKGMSLQESGDSAGAMRVYEDVILLTDQEIRKHPNYAVYDAELWTNRGDALSRLGRYEKAVTAYETALEINPKFERAEAGRTFAMDAILLARGKPTLAENVTEAAGFNPLPTIVPLSWLSAISALIGAAFLVALRPMLKKP